MGKKSELERLMEMDAQRKQREEAAAASKAAEERTENWLCPGIIVKVGVWGCVPLWMCRMYATIDGLVAGSTRPDKCPGPPTTSNVQIINKKVGGGKYYKQKGRVERVIDKFVGEVKLLEGGDRLRIDQDELETVIPAVGGTVLIVNGRGKGLLAEMLELDVDNYAARVRVLEGVLKGEKLKGVAYEDISKADRDFLRR